LAVNAKMRGVIVVMLVLAGALWALTGLLIWHTTAGDQTALSFARAEGILAVPGLALCVAAAYLLVKRKPSGFYVSFIVLLLVMTLAGVGGSQELGEPMTRMLAAVICLLCILAFIALVVNRASETARHDPNPPTDESVSREGENPFQ